MCVVQCAIIILGGYRVIIYVISHERMFVCGQQSLKTVVELIAVARVYKKPNKRKRKLHTGNEWRARRHFISSGRNYFFIASKPVNIFELRFRITIISKFPKEQKKLLARYTIMGTKMKKFQMF